MGWSLWFKARWWWRECFVAVLPCLNLHLCFGSMERMRSCCPTSQSFSTPQGCQWFVLHAELFLGFFPSLSEKWEGDGGDSSWATVSEHRGDILGRNLHGSFPCTLIHTHTLKKKKTNYTVIGFSTLEIFLVIVYNTSVILFVFSDCFFSVYFLAHRDILYAVTCLSTRFWILDFKQGFSKEFTSTELRKANE